MQSAKEKKEKKFKVGFFFAMLLVGAVLVPYALSVEEPTKVLLLGASLVGVGVWGRRHLKRHENP
jgi:hypothetical protein